MVLSAGVLGPTPSLGDGSQSRAHHESPMAMLNYPLQGAARQPRVETRCWEKGFVLMQLSRGHMENCLQGYSSPCLLQTRSNPPQCCAEREREVREGRGVSRLNQCHRSKPQAPVG